MPELPVIKPGYCNGCGLCVNVCTCGVIKMVGKVVKIVEGGECSWCTQCEAVCPTGAIVCPFQIIEEHREIT